MQEPAARTGESSLVAPPVEGATTPGGRSVTAIPIIGTSREAAGTG